MNPFPNNLKIQLKIDSEKLSSSLEEFIRAHMEKLEREGVIFGLSGGVDSSVVGALCKRAVGSEKTLALIMPEKDSKKEHIKDALRFASEFNIETRVIDISPYLKALGTYKLFPLNKLPFSKKIKGNIVRKAYQLYTKKAGETPFSNSLLGFKDKKFGLYLKKGNAYYRIKHRLRMILLYLHGELENRLVVGAANKTEYKIGFFVKHGCDHAADIMPLLSLYKTQVIEIAKFLKIPSAIIEKPPSPDIIPGIIDEDAIGVPYEKLDLILMALEQNWKHSDIAGTLGVEENQVGYVAGLVQKSEHMRETYAPNRGADEA
jgi:NAD+ synthase